MIVAGGEDKLCIAELKYFRSEQGIMNRSLLDERYQSLKNIINNHVDEPYRKFLARPYKTEGEVIWFGKKFKETPSPITDLSGEKLDFYQKLLQDNLDHYEATIQSLRNRQLETEAEYLEKALKFVDERFVYCYDNYVVLAIWGIQLREKVRETFGIAVRQTFPLKVFFEAGEGGTIEGLTQLKKEPGVTITEDEIPKPVPSEGYELEGWDKDPKDFKILRDTIFTATFTKKEVEVEDKSDEGENGTQPPTPPPPPPPPPPPNEYTIRFALTGKGSFNGATEILREEGDWITAADIPEPVPGKNEEFLKWNEEPVNHVVKGDKTFTAEFKKIPWYKRLWIWFKTKGWKWLLLLLLLLLLLWLLSKLLEGCESRSTETNRPFPVHNLPEEGSDPNVNRGGFYNPGEPYTPQPTPNEPGNEILPPNQREILPVEENPEIIEKPGQPKVIANRLNILMENEAKSIIELAKAFKAEYPGDEYKVVYYDDVVKRMQIEFPVTERERLKQEIPAKFSEFEVFVFDESLFEMGKIFNDPVFKNEELSWYYNFINAFKAWDITEGDDKVRIAIVDNGFNLNHPEFKGKIVGPYNVWTQSSVILPQEIDHGTHVAGTALAIANNNEGLSGIAPHSEFMPVQVADANGLMTTTSVLDGILYAIYQGADVINVSLGNAFFKLDEFPQDAQQTLIRQHFKEEERLWKKVTQIADKHKRIIVVAAGNDNVLAGIAPLQRPKNIIVVSAIDKKMSPIEKTSFSNYGNYSNVSAPGVGIYSSYGNGYQVLDGTSMAAPMVAGAIGLIKSIDKSITAEQVICALQATGMPVQGNIGNLIQIDKLLEFIKQGSFGSCANEEMPIPSTGDVQILLKWHDLNDLDLLCRTPSNEWIWYKNEFSSDGGQLEIDMNANPQYLSRNPVENIYWPTGGAPNGDYEVYVSFYDRHENHNTPTSFEVTIKYDGKTEVVKSSVSTIKEDKHISSFSIGNSASNSQTRNTNVAKELLELRKKQLEMELNEVNKELKNFD